MRTYTAGSQVKSSDLNLLIINKRHRIPTPSVATNWAANTTFNGWTGTPGLASSGAGDAFIDLDVPEGYRLATLTLLCMGNSSANLTIGIDKAMMSNAQNVSQCALVSNAISGTPADITLNMLAASTTNAGGQSVTVSSDLGSPANGIYTRSAGSFLTDGFFVGQVVTWSGFANAGNNATTTITALTATAMTTTNTGFVAETSGANVAQANGFSPVVDPTFSLQLKLTASATGLQVKGLRYTICPV